MRRHARSDPMSRHRTVSLTPKGEDVVAHIRRGGTSALADLTERHHGRTVTVIGLTGRLDGILPVADRIALALTVGGSRVFTTAMPADTAVEICREER